MKRLYRIFYEEKLIDADYEIDKASNCIEVIYISSKGEIDLTIMDIRMSDIDGIVALCKVITLEKKIPVIKSFHSLRVFYTFLNKPLHR